MTGAVLVYSRATVHHHTGGMETMAWSLATEWARTVPVWMVTTAVPGASAPFQQDGVHVVPLPGTRPGRYSRQWWAASVQHWRKLSATTAGRGDTPMPVGVVLSVSAGAYAVVRERARQPRVPFVMQAHGTSTMELVSKLRTPRPRSLAGAPKNALGLVRDLARYRDFDRVVAVGDNVARSLAARPIALPAGRVHLIPNGVRERDHAFDPVARQRIRAVLGIGDEVTVVGCVGRLHPQKRLDRALRAVAVLRDRGRAGAVRLLVVGDGPDEGRLRHLVAREGLTDLVTFVGRVEPERVRDYTAAADVALLTTGRREGLPMAVLEGLASGLPCVVPSGSLGAGALQGAVHQVDPDDAGGLADLLHRHRPHGGAGTTRASLLPAPYRLEYCAAAYLDAFANLAAAAR